MRHAAAVHVLTNRDDGIWFSIEIQRNGDAVVHQPTDTFMKPFKMH